MLRFLQVRGIPNPVRRYMGTSQAAVEISDWQYDLAPSMGTIFFSSFFEPMNQSAVRRWRRAAVRNDDYASTTTVVFLPSSPAKVNHHHHHQHQTEVSKGAIPCRACAGRAVAKPTRRRPLLPFQPSRDLFNSKRKTIDHRKDIHAIYVQR